MLCVAVISEVVSVRTRQPAQLPSRASSSVQWVVMRADNGSPGGSVSLPMLPAIIPCSPFR